MKVQISGWPVKAGVTEGSGGCCEGPGKLFFPSAPMHGAADLERTVPSTVATDCDREQKIGGSASRCTTY